MERETISMEMYILNASSGSIGYLLQYIERNIPKGFELSPITINFGLLKYETTVDEEIIKIDVLDYYDDENNVASITLEDPYLNFNELTFNNNKLTVDDEQEFTLKLCPKTKKAPK